MRYSDELHSIARGAIAGVGAGQQLNGISFPSNATSPTDAYVAIEYANPEDNGLPITGPSEAGITVVREINVRQQTAASNGTYYYAQFWYTTADRAFTPLHNWGFHPYPQAGSPGTDPNSYWEIAGHGADIVATRPNETGAGNAPTFDRWYTQAFRLTKTGAGAYELLFYIDLPSTANANVIEHDEAVGSYLESPATASLIVIGDSPWYAGFQHEKFSGIQGRIKIFGTSLSESDILSEAADMSQLATAAGEAAIWWGKTNFDSITDLTCDYGTGRSFTWNNSNRGTLVAIDP